MAHTYTLNENPAVGTILAHNVPCVCTRTFTRAEPGPKTPTHRNQPAAHSVSSGFNGPRCAADRLDLAKRIRCIYRPDRQRLRTMSVGSLTGIPGPVECGM